MRALKAFSLAVAVLVPGACASGPTDFPNQELQIGSAPPCTINNSRLLSISSAQLSPSCEALVSGTTFDVSVDRDGLVNFITTSDATFKTGEGVSVGFTLIQVRSAGGAGVVAEPGWGYYTELGSGWAARFPGTPGGSGEPPGPDTRVVSLFLR